MLGVGNKNGTEDEAVVGVVARSAVAGAEGLSVVGTGVDDAPGIDDGMTPPGGVKNTTPPLAGTEDGSGMVDTPGPAGDGSGGDDVAAGSSDGAGGAAAAASMAESVRLSAAMARGLDTAVLR
jgi:hypothetical protein